MPLQTSGPISLGDIATEFGGAAPHSLSEYYRGGGLVPDTAANAGIPTSGPISLSDFYGGDATVPPATPVDVIGGGVVVVAPGGSQTAAYQLTSGGAEREGEGGSFVTTNTWLLQGSAGDYQCRMTMQSGTTFSGSPTGSWLALSLTRTWELTDPVEGLPSLQGEGLIEIRDASTLEILDSATVNLSSRQML